MSKSRTISDQLRDSIRSSGVLAETADRAGVDVGQVYRFVNGQRGLTLATMDKLGEALGLRLIETGRPARVKAKASARVKPARRPAKPPGAPVGDDDQVKGDEHLPLD